VGLGGEAAGGTRGSGQRPHGGERDGAGEQAERGLRHAARRGRMPNKLNAGWTENSQPRKLRHDGLLTQMCTTHVHNERRPAGLAAWYTALCDLSHAISIPSNPFHSSPARERRSTPASSPHGQGVGAAQQMPPHLPQGRCGPLGAETPPLRTYEQGKSLPVTGELSEGHPCGAPRQSPPSALPTFP
jgi:hypothetical protein